MPAPKHRKHNKNYQIPWEDEIQKEMLTILVEETIKRLYGIIKNAWFKERLPVDWDTTLVCNIPKKIPTGLQ